MDSQLRGYLWTRNCRVFFGLAIAWFLWARNCVVSCGLAIAWYPLGSQLHGFLWTRNYMISFGPAIARFPLDSQLRGFLLTRLCRFQIPYFIFQIPDSGFQIADFRLQISDFRFQISHFRLQIPGQGEPGSRGWGNLLAGVGGTRPGDLQSLPFKKLYKNPLEIPKGIPS